MEKSGKEEPKKFIVLCSLGENLGGAQIRYINLFNQIIKDRSDYRLVLNTRLQSLAVAAGLLNRDERMVLIIDDHMPPIQKKLVPSSITVPAKRSFLRLTLQSIRSYGKYLTLVQSFQGLVKEYRPNYVYGIWLGGMIAWPLKYFYGYSFTYAYMDSGLSSIHRMWQFPLRNERMPLKFADRIDFLSADLKTKVAYRVDLNPSCLFVSPCSFKDYSGLNPAVKEGNRITFCARLELIKNPLLFLRALVVVRERYPRFDTLEINILGDGPLYSACIQFAQDQNLSNVNFTGFIANASNYLSISDVFVTIQQINNYPSQSLLEAMACENAIVASDVGETRSLVTDLEGCLVALEEEGIADALISLMTNPADRMEKAAKARSKVLSEHTVERFLDYFYSLENK